ncbi:Nitroreductase-like protein [Aspergillus karnatakaensis]|uniref:Nitroreductase-like protein n=1 Tax=Aspergillus karnatakaensis TaxID=1810916 RepID=UPI003CCD810E
MTVLQSTLQNPATATLLKLVQARRIYYSLSAASPVPDAAIEEIMQNAVLHVPSSFNSQTTRVVLLLKDEHQRLWDATIEIMEGLVAVGTVPRESFEGHTRPKLERFRNSYGTVLFFVDYEALAPIKDKYKLYAHMFDPFALESNAMAQFLGMSPPTLGFGANLQPYNPLIDTKLSAQLVFGTPTGEPEDKTFEPLESRYKVFGR